MSEFVFTNKTSAIKKVIILKPAFKEMLSGILLYLFKPKTKIGAVSNIAVT